MREPTLLKTVCNRQLVLFFVCEPSHVESQGKKTTTKASEETIKTERETEKENKTKAAKGENKLFGLI